MTGLEGFMQEFGGEQEYTRIQNGLAGRIVLENSFADADIRKVAGVDLAYWDMDGKDFAVCAVVVIDRATKSPIEMRHLVGEVKVPYVAGFLSFRELPLVVQTCGTLENEPDLIMFDGNGILHPRKMGIATHASFCLNKPTIGIAKSYYRISGSGYEMPGIEKGSATDLAVNGEVLGRALRTRDGVKPVFVSCGNLVDLDTATRLALEFVSEESRLPIPVRIADMETRRLRQGILASG